MPLRGYIILSHNGSALSEGREAIYDDFSPYLLAQYRDRALKEFDSFDEAVDEFFATVEKQREEQKKTKLENAAMKKVRALGRRKEVCICGWVKDACD